MKYDLNMLSNNVIPKIRQAKATLNDCRGAISAISIPSDFPDAGKIRSASGKVSNIISMLSSGEASVNTTINNFKSVIAKNNQIMDKTLSTMQNLMKNDKSTGKESTNLFGIKTYAPGESGIDRNLVRKFKRNRWKDRKRRRSSKNCKKNSSRCSKCRYSIWKRSCKPI